MDRFLVGHSYTDVHGDKQTVVDIHETYDMTGKRIKVVYITANKYGRDYVSPLEMRRYSK